MADGGTLAIQTENVEIDSAYVTAHADVSAGRYVLLQVTDSGVGMDEETVGRVFDPFFTTKEEGTGLGLSTVHGIVKQSGGHILVYSEPGIGTTFKVYVPATDAPIAPIVIPVPIESYEGSETILLVEDSEPLRELVAEVLESYGYTVTTAANGPEALELAAREPQREIHLLLTDVVMPHMNGREVADELIRSRPGLRVLFTSGYPSDIVIRRGIAEARTDFLQKPYSATALAQKIREVLASD
jgi:two-component system cell cycle sensor histidine kinase/response regulator CckA